MSAVDESVVLVWCPQDNCGQLAEIHDALELPAEGNSCGHAVLVVSVRCLAGHHFRGPLDGRFESAEVAK